MEQLLRRLDLAWYQEDLLVAIVLAGLLAFFFGGFYPKGLPKEEVNRRIEQAFSMFNFLLYGLFVFGGTAVVRSSEAAPLFYFPLVYVILLYLRLQYKLFLLREDAQWHTEKILKELTRDRREESEDKDS